MLGEVVVEDAVNDGVEGVVEVVVDGAVLRLPREARRSASLSAIDRVLLPGVAALPCRSPSRPTRRRVGVDASVVNSTFAGVVVSGNTSVTGTTSSSLTGVVLAISSEGLVVIFL